MASTQCERKQLSCEQKANLDKSIKCAEEFYVSGDIAKKARDIIAEKECKGKEESGVEPRVSLLAGAMTNQTTKGSLYVVDSTLWKGYIASDYTDPLEVLGTFAQGALFGGVEAGVVYGGKNKNGVECAWLLAWSDSNGRKAYAECGPRENYNNINWNAIRDKLKDSDFIAIANDSRLGISVYATIVGASAGSAVAVYYSG